MVEYFSLEMITSVGYRVKSKQGVAFRKWANSVLKQYLIKGYAINQQIKLDRYNELKDVVRLMSRALRRGRTQAHCRQRTCGAHADDCRE